MTTHASAHAPASPKARDDGGPGSRLGNSRLPLDDASRHAGAIVDPGTRSPREARPRPDLNHVKAGLQAATADLHRLRGRLLQALNKGLVLRDMGAILGRLEDLWQSIPDAPSDRRAPPTHTREASASPATGQAPEIPA
jgi:hypothetical protein